MPNSIYGMHHFQRRKRGHKALEPYPSPNKFKRFMDKAIYVVGVAGPVFTIPQVTKIWVEKNASGVSAIAWISYLVLAVFWLTYGILHKEKPIILANILWIFLEIFIVAGILTYG
jgi:uncharacterized protein with PQ loop repeat